MSLEICPALPALPMSTLAQSIQLPSEIVKGLPLHRGKDFSIPYVNSVDLSERIKVPHKNLIKALSRFNEALSYGNSEDVLTNDSSTWNPCQHPDAVEYNRRMCKLLVPTKGKIRNSKSTVNCYLIPIGTLYSFAGRTRYGQKDEVSLALLSIQNSINELFLAFAKQLAEKIVDHYETLILDLNLQLHESRTKVIELSPEKKPPKIRTVQVHPENPEWIQSIEVESSGDLIQDAAYRASGFCLGRYEEETKNVSLLKEELFVFGLKVTDLMPGGGVSIL